MCGDSGARLPLRIRARAPGYSDTLSVIKRLMAAMRAQPARKSAAFRPADVVVVLEVMGQFMHFDGVKPRVLKIPHRHLLAPHCAEAIAPLRQRHRHAVHARNRVKQGTNRVLPVVLDVARGFDVLRQVDSVVGQRNPNAA